MKEYVTPNIRVIELSTECLVATSEVVSVNFREGTGETLSQKKKDIWGNEGIWK